MLHFIYNTEYLKKEETWDIFALSRLAESFLPLSSLLCKTYKEYGYGDADTSTTAL
jgi:hypothetical protein